MMNFRFTALLLPLMLALSGAASAGVVVGATRIIYNADQQEVQLPVKNNDQEASHLVQSWVSNLDDQGKPAFIVTPPLFKLAAQHEMQLHFIYSGTAAALPQDRESVFWANIKSIAATPDAVKEKSKLQIAAKTRIKLFYRPAALTNKSAQEAYKKLTFTRQGNTLHVTNPTPFYITLQDITVGGIQVMPPENSLPALSMMISPFSEQNYSVPGNAHGAVTWSAITDYGGRTKPLTQ
ncbi:molecular chaperone [Nissabacter archeti]|nr:molecular chaperone [Nissabacter archeti]